MIFNFPTTPTLNQEYIGPNGVVYTYDGDKWNGTAQLVTVVGDSGSGGSSVQSTEIEPSSPSTGDMWFKPSTKTLSIWDGSAWQYFNTTQSIVYPSENGEVSYTQPGTYSWVCPAGVNYVHAVCVGGGGGGGYYIYGGSGGGAGGLAWANDIPVVPGTSYTVAVGAGTTVAGSVRLTAGNSYFKNTSTVIAYGGTSGVYNSNAIAGSGGGFYPYGGTGGNGGNDTNNSPGGGGGAGGYSGNGGAGGAGNFAGSNGTGGAGGGGGGGSGANRGAGGGGVGILGQGTSGSGGSITVGGTAGSGGSSGVGTAAGIYGGGGGGADSSGYSAGNGGDGAVRIIWGPNRAFPSTNTGVL
jgi:hypothetical protein